ncbi:hypothetical protein ACFLU6_14075, partial [Acidobacteriota bacterium]
MNSALSRYRFCLIVFVLLRISSTSDIHAVEKPIPPQEELDACFAGGFSVDAQMQKTYTRDELAGLDRALQAWDMTRHDMTFRKDYTKGHLAFPLILDMMKHPMHIALYMDGFCASIDALNDHDLFAVPEILASAKTHPGI